MAELLVVQLVQKKAEMRVDLWAVLKVVPWVQRRVAL